MTLNLLFVNFCQSLTAVLKKLGSVFVKKKTNKPQYLTKHRAKIETKEEKVTGERNEREVRRETCSHSGKAAGMSCITVEKKSFLLIVSVNIHICGQWLENGFCGGTSASTLPDVTLSIIIYSIMSKFSPWINAFAPFCSIFGNVPLKKYFLLLWRLSY